MVNMIVFSLFIAALCVIPTIHAGKGKAYWQNLAKEELRKVLESTPDYNVAKNVIIFVGDGMGMPVITSGRFYKGQQKGNSGEDEKLSFEKFPYVGLSKTYSSNKQVSDSASTASAMFTGFKVNQETISVDDSVQLKNCSSSLDPDTHLSSFMAWAQEAGKETGIITNTRITHATPAATYAHSASRTWECDGKMPPSAAECPDIARQLVEGKVGREFKVIFGGGRQCFFPNSSLTDYNKEVCSRRDERNLVEEWIACKKALNVTYKYVENAQELEDIDTDTTDFMFGLFSVDHLPYSYQTDKNSPQLKTMVEKAIDRLERGPNGYALMVEGGRIDHALHENYARKALHELVSFDEAIEAAVNKVNLNETLIIVTADHSHGLVMIGYPFHGNSILGVAEESAVDHLPYTTLMFATGSSYDYFTNGTHVLRPNVSNIDTASFDYHHLSAIPREYDDAAHTGEEVPIYAIGPRSYIFTGVHEQNFIAHAIRYAAELGDFQ